MKHLKVLVLVAGFLCAAVFYLMTEKKTEEVVFLTEETRGEASAEGGGQKEAPQTLPQVQVICSCACGANVNQGTFSTGGSGAEQEAPPVAGTQPSETAPLEVQPIAPPPTVQQAPEPSYAAQETAAPKEGAAASGLVNLNTADKTKLMTLPGIGESKAEAILRYREEYGPFAHIEEIMNISGIKNAAFAKIKDQITVS